MKTHVIKIPKVKAQEAPKPKLERKKHIKNAVKKGKS